MGCHGNFLLIIICTYLLAIASLITIVIYAAKLDDQRRLDIRAKEKDFGYKFSTKYSQIWPKFSSKFDKITKNADPIFFQIGDKMKMIRDYS